MHVLRVVAFGWCRNLQSYARLVGGWLNYEDSCGAMSCWVCKGKERVEGCSGSIMESTLANVSI
jgi:hypothetical protein